jgi:uncharacterized protein YjbI with pentapeptide repeats
MAPLFQRLFAVEEEEERPKAAPGAARPAAGEAGAPEPTTRENASISEKTSPAEATAPGSAVTETSQLTVNGSPASQEAMIPASNLPSAADTLAQLFAEAPGGGAPVAAKAPTLVTGPETAVEKPAVDVAPKRQGLFARLFGPKPPAKPTAELPAPVAQNSSIAAPSEAEIEAAVAVAGTCREAAVEFSGDSLVLAEIPNIHAPAAESFTVVAPPAQTPILAEELPSAADAFKELFEETSALTTADVSIEADEELQAVEAEAETVEIAEEVPVLVAAQATNSAAPEMHFAETAENQSVGDETHTGEKSAAFSTHLRAESPRGEVSAEAAAEIERGVALPTRPAPEPHGDHAVPHAAAFETPQQKFEVAVPGGSQDGSAEEPAGTEISKTPSLPGAPQRLYKDWALDEKLASHGEWVESHGRTGQRADLSGAELEASDLISVNLRLADMHDANLRASDLLLADLRDACLVRADLEEACLVGANLEGANLEGASLETAMGLVPRQFAGANLRDALLAPHLMEFEAVSAFDRESKNAFRYFWMMSAASVLSWLVIAKTRDAQLLTDSAIIPYLHSRAAAAALPTAESYLIVPVALFVLYVLFHFHLQRLWDSVVELPAIFPDGHTLGDAGPGIMSGLLRTHFRWMNPDPSSTRLVEKSASLAAAYWIVPATLLLFWARYLTRQEIHGTILHALLAMSAVGMATYATMKVGRPQERWAFENKWIERVMERLKSVHPVSVAATVATILLLLSAGVIFGVPHDRNRAPQFGVANIRRWAPNAFWWIAYDPYPDLTEASISRRPANWTGGDDQVSSVDGMRANNAKFRYAQGYGAFFANAHLWRADFQGAFLSEADLRGADLGQSNMRYAVMDHAQMNHANLDRSNLDGADMRRADLRDANLSYCSLENAILVDARLDGASFYTARLPGATLTRAIMEKADLRESRLAGAHMDHADLRSAYLWSARLPGADLGGAQLESAILIDADLHGANLGGAQLTGTVLNGADLSGTSLEGADLRGALGLSANQVCSAKSRRGVVLDPDTETQVEAQCGKQ